MQNISMESIDLAPHASFAQTTNHFGTRSAVETALYSTPLLLLLLLLLLLTSTRDRDPLPSTAPSFCSDQLFCTTIYLAERARFLLKARLSSLMDNDAERVARRILDHHAEEVERIKSVLVSCIERLKSTDREGWRKEGNDLVDWMLKEATDMASAERDVAIAKTTGGSASIVGGVMTGMGIVGSFFTFGLATSLAVAGLAVAGAGAATSAGGDIARLSILHKKTCEIKKRCESFEQKSEGIVVALVDLRAVLTDLTELCKKQKMPANDSVAGISVVQLVLRSGKTATNLMTAGVNTFKIAASVYDIAQMQRSGVIFGMDYLRVMAGTITGSGLSVSKALFKGVDAVLGIGFGIWDVVEASGTLKNGGSHSELIRNNAGRMKTTITEVDNALRQLDL